MRDGVSYVSDPTYTYSQSEAIIDFFSTDPYKIVITATLVDTDTGEYQLNVTVTDKNDTEIENAAICRYNSKNFYAMTSSEISSDKDYSIKNSDTSGHSFTNTYVNFYAAVNFRGDFSNIFWSSLYWVGSLQLD